jgi:anti-sigma factor RsiW
MNACPDKILLLHGFVDGELDAANSLAFEAHLKTCRGCAEELARTEELRAMLGTHDLRYVAPAALRDRIERAIEESLPAGLPAAMTERAVERAMPRRAISHWASFAGGAIAASLAGLLFLSMSPDEADTGSAGSAAAAPLLQEQIVAGHVRSLQAAHLTDVLSTEKHTVKPWFNGKIDFSPPVPDLTPDGFPLAGGRLDYLGGRAVAAIVYHRRLHPINLFVRPVVPGSAPMQPGAIEEEGYHLVRWTAGGFEYFAISDLNMKELQQFRTLFEQRTSG